MVDRLPVFGESCLAVAYHDPSVRIYPEEITHVALRGLAVSTLSAFPGEDREDMVSRSKISHTFSHTLYNSTGMKQSQLISKRSRKE